ncbi:MCP four helix bundle domain-containing protein [Asticcacaulis sp. MM231]|uniref:MCP four helix bundle domain-containing protein n=1 Tax=Asticcacaulis sp. MM231 TaxID=3157666 RepID=UPI0032D585E6
MAVSIRTRVLILVGCFALMAFVVTGLGLITIGDYNRMMKQYDHAYDHAWRGERFNHLISNSVMETRGIYIARNPQELTSFVTSLNRNLDEMQTLLAQWKADSTPAEKPRLEAISGQMAGFIALRRQVAQLATKGDIAGARGLSDGNRADRIAFQAQVDALVQGTQKDLIAAQKEADSYSKKRAGDFLLTALLGIAAIMALSLWIVAHFITNPLRNLAAAIIKTSKGEYEDVPVAESEGEDEVSSVWRALAVLKERAIEAEQLSAAKAQADREKELKLREILLD